MATRSWPTKPLLDEDRFDLSLLSWLAAAEGRTNDREAQNPEVWSNYRAKANGALPANFDSGQAATQYVPTALPAIISNGAMGMQQNGVLKAAYVSAPLDGPVTRFGSTFRFSGGTGGITATATHILSPATYVHGVDMAAHVTVGPTVLTWQVRTGGGAVPFTTVYTYNFPTPLALDTDYSIEAQIDGQTVVLVDPYGELHTFFHAEIASNNGGYMTWEPYQDNLTTDPVVWFREVWADSAKASTLRSSTTRLSRLKQLLDKRQPQIKAAQYAPASDTTLALSGTRQEINSALRLPVVFPASGQIEVEVQAFMTLSSGYVFCAVTPNSNLAGGAALHLAGTNETTGLKRGSVIYSGTPGAAVTLYFGFWVASGSATVSSYSGVGRYSIVKATPI